MCNWENSIFENTNTICCDRRIIFALESSQHVEWIPLIISSSVAAFFIRSQFPGWQRFHGGWDQRVRRQKEEKEASPQPNDIHELPTGWTWEGIQRRSLSRRLRQRNVVIENWLARRQNTSEYRCTQMIHLHLHSFVIINSVMLSMSHFNWRKVMSTCSIAY